LTDSGLSITEWNLFSGFLPPLNDENWIKYFNLYKEIPEYKNQNYSMTLKEFKVIFWWEWIHRFLGRLIGISFLLPLIFFSLKVGVKKLANLYMIFILICLQGYIGWYMVSSGLVDRVDVSHFRLSIHLLIAFLILSLILWNYLKLKDIYFPIKKINFLIPVIFLILMFCQISIGAFVSGMDAGKIYNTWPLMGSSYFPDDNQIINLFDFNVFNDPSLVQFIHRNLAYIILLFYVFILIKVYRKNLTDFYYSINLLGLLLIIQIILGIFTLLFDAHIIIASMHQISSVFLVSSSIYFLYLNSNTN
jgi:cytochrome c oxidase assembly protein subunit 15